MTSSIEARVPFVDRQLASEVSAILHAVDIQKATDGKRILKQVLERYLPVDLVYRSKKGFGVPMRSYEARTFRADFDKACAFHLAHQDAFAVAAPLAELIGSVAARAVIIRKYPRFAFALVSNWKCFEGKRG